MAHASTGTLPDRRPEAGGPVLPAAELDRRFYAFVLDRLVGWGLAAAGTWSAYRLLIEPGHPAAGVALAVALVLLIGLGSALLLGLGGTSPGKAALGLRVVQAGTAEPVGVGPALLRTFVLGLAALPTLGLGVATLAWTAVMDRTGQRRGWHDHLAGSAVVDVRPVPVEEAAPEPAPRTIVNLTAMRLVPPPAPGTTTPVRPPAPLAPAAAPRPGPPPAAPRPVGPPPAAPPAGARWRVAFDTGEAFLVEGLALVGRGPEPRPGEQARHLVPLRSSDMSLSKTHAQFQVVPDGALVVMDRGSTNGSVLVRRGVPRDLGPGRPTTLLDGDLVRFGDRSMSVTREA
ncbi:RDD family protein [Nocardioides pantholopis]|uniref:RDD family protein n=1 Tax=Nocardioides pantholopis TaxID=2483798 RepID=UPI000FD849A4|nr:RDD family protein [Nocardioides pantholopis]